MAKKNGHGGKRKGAGRPTKDEEQKARRLTVQALESEFGSLEEAMQFGAKQIKDGGNNSFQYFKLLLEYAFGKPKDSIDITSGDEPIQNFNLSKLSEKELAIILKLHDGPDSDPYQE